jgi:hypothetical protein
VIFLGARGSVGRDSFLRSRQVLAIKNIVLNGERVSARAVQRKIGGQRLTPQELDVLIKKLPLSVRASLLRGTIRNQPKHHARVLEKKRLIKRFIVSESLKGRSVSPKQIKLRYGGRMDTITKLFNEIESDLGVKSFLEKKGARITRTLPGGQRKDSLFPFN